MENAYRNTDLRAIKGERWKDLPGLEGYFLISNYGRVKRCRYEMQYRNGAIYMKPEIIIKPGIAEHPNNFVGDTTHYLFARVTLSGRRYLFMIARLVYYCFVQRFDLTDHAIQIVSKNGDNFYIRPSNLRAVTRSEKQQRIIARNRFRSPLLDMPEEIREKIRQKNIRSLQKEVSQYSLSGKKMGTYQSLAQAQQATGISKGCISNVAKGKYIRAGKYLWRWGHEDTINVKEFLEARRKKNRERHGMKVTQYTLSGDRITRYPSVQDAQEATGAKGDAIRLVIRGKYKSAHGYFWKKGYGPEKINLTGYRWGRESTAVTQSKRIAQFSTGGKRIQTFDSIKDAAAALRVGSSSLSAACRGAQRTCMGYTWKFV
jgi:hypothetical protein